MAATRPRGIGPVVARSQLSSPAARPVVARSQPSSPGQHPSSTDLVPVIGRCVPVVTHFFKLPYPSSCIADPLSRAVDPSSRAANRRRDLPRPPRTRPREPYKYARVLLFPCTLSEHPGLHLPRRLLAGFSKGCFTFFIARHPPRLEFREYCVVHSALVNLDYIEIKYYFFFSLGLLALG